MKFPIFERIEIDKYRLYPGRKRDQGFALPLTPGPWIILGINGIGKSTLLLILKFVLTGPVRIRGAGFTGERSDIVSVDGRLFAVRVRDSAQDATATIIVRFGNAVLEIKRRLSDLGLVDASLTNEASRESALDEATYRGFLTRAMGLTRFEDTLRVLDRVVFILEERQPLIWDVSAQFELFRAILTPELSQELRRLEGEIVSNDSAARNLNAVLYKLVSRRDTEIARQKQSAVTLARLAKATAELDVAESTEGGLQFDLERLEEQRSDARIKLKRADVAADDAAQAYEELKFRALRHAFAGVTPSEQYVFLKLISERICPACGNSADAAAKALEKRRDENRCLVCGTIRPQGGKLTTTAARILAKAKKAFATLGEKRQARELAQTQFDEASSNYAAKTEALEQCSSDS